MCPLLLCLVLLPKPAVSSITLSNYDKHAAWLTTSLCSQKMCHGTDIKQGGWGRGVISAVVDFELNICVFLVALSHGGPGGVCNNLWQQVTLQCSCHLDRYSECEHTRSQNWAIYILSAGIAIWDVFIGLELIQSIMLFKWNREKCTVTQNTHTAYIKSKTDLFLKGLHWP